MNGVLTADRRNTGRGGLFAANGNVGNKPGLIRDGRTTDRHVGRSLGTARAGLNAVRSGRLGRVVPTGDAGEGRVGGLPGLVRVVRTADRHSGRSLGTARAGLTATRVGDPVRIVLTGDGRVRRVRDVARIGRILDGRGHVAAHRDTPGHRTRVGDRGRLRLPGTPVRRAEFLAVSGGSPPLRGLLIDRRALAVLGGRGTGNPASVDWTIDRRGHVVTRWDVLGNHTESRSRRPSGMCL